MAIVLSLMLFIPMLYWFGLTGWTSAVALVGSGVCVATIGFMDDHGHIAARWRLLGHFASASWAVFWLGGLPSIHVFSYTLDLGLLGEYIGKIFEETKARPAFIRNSLITRGEIRQAQRNKRRQ